MVISGNITIIYNMPSLKDQIVADMKQAMRDKNTPHLQTIRALRAAIQRQELDSRHELSEAEVLDVVQKLVKQGKDAASQFLQGNRPDLAEKERAEIDIFNTYLPTQLGDEEVLQAIEAAISESKAASMRDMGKVMALLKTQLANQADMGKVSALVKNRLG